MRGTTVRTFPVYPAEKVEQVCITNPLKVFIRIKKMNPAIVQSQSRVFRQTQTVWVWFSSS